MYLIDTSKYLSLILCHKLEIVDIILAEQM